jgi:hypothetical protein
MSRRIRFSRLKSLLNKILNGHNADRPRFQCLTGHANVSLILSRDRKGAVFLGMCIGGLAYNKRL